jgi:hypothetical protein
MGETPAQPLTYSLAEVAALFRNTADSFRAKRPELEAAGFPKKLPGSVLWSRAAVDHWFNTAGLTYAPLMGPPPDGVEGAREALERRYG